MTDQPAAVDYPTADTPLLIDHLVPAITRIAVAVRDQQEPVEADLAYTARCARAFPALFGRAPALEEPDMSIETRLRKLEDQAAPARPLTWAEFAQAADRLAQAEATNQPPPPADVAYCARFLAAFPALAVAAVEGEGD